MNEQNSQQQHFSVDQKTQTENQNIANDTFRSHDDREKVMANDEAFGTLDFQHDDIQRDADNLMQQLLPAFSDDNPKKAKLSLDADKCPSNTQTDAKTKTTFPLTTLLRRLKLPTTTKMTHN